MEWVVADKGVRSGSSGQTLCSGPHGDKLGEKERNCTVALGATVTGRISQCAFWDNLSLICQFVPLL